VRQRLTHHQLCPVVGSDTLLRGSTRRDALSVSAKGRPGVNSMAAPLVLRGDTFVLLTPPLPLLYSPPAPPVIAPGTGEKGDVVALLAGHSRVVLISALGACFVQACARSPKQAARARRALLRGLAPSARPARRGSRHGTGG
jgi:hypothetical protein